MVFNIAYRLADCLADTWIQWIITELLQTLVSQEASFYRVYFKQADACLIKSPVHLACFFKQMQAFLSPKTLQASKMAQC